MERIRTDAEQLSKTIEPADSVMRVARRLGSDPAFADRVRVAAVMTAVSVAAEDPRTANHPNRARLAQQVLMSPERWGQLMAEAVAVNPSIAAAAGQGSEIPDNDIAFAVSSLWNAYAGSGGQGGSDA